VVFTRVWAVPADVGAARDARRVIEQVAYGEKMSSCRHDLVEDEPHLVSVVDVDPGAKTRRGVSR
jgi:hypothetical protein